MGDVFRKKKILSLEWKNIVDKQLTYGIIDTQSNNEGEINIMENITITFEATSIDLHFNRFLTHMKLQNPLTEECDTFGIENEESLRVVLNKVHDYCKEYNFLIKVAIDYTFSHDISDEGYGCVIFDGELSYWKNIIV